MDKGNRGSYSQGLMDDEIRNQLKPGTRVKVTQQIPARDRAWSSAVAGTVVSFQQKPTGSWYAHAKDDRLWLDRLQLRKADGELTTLNLDGFSRIEILPGEEPATPKRNETDLPA